MNTRIALFTLAGIFLANPSVHAGSELQQLRDRVAEQERQIRLLEEQNAQLRADGSSRSSHGLQAEGTNLITATSQTTSRSAPSSETYTVMPGDNLVRIGRNLGISAQMLAKANGLETSSVIHPGQKLKVPRGKTPTAATKTPASASTSTTGSKTHVVQAGETFYSISRQHGVAVDLLMAANPETEPASLRVGQNLRVPQSNSPTASAAASNPEMTSAPSVESSPETQPAAQPTGNRRQIRTIMIDGEMSYGAFAAKHGTTPERLNQLNGLDLDARTVLAKGSELYVPAQP